MAPTTRRALALSSFALLIGCAALWGQAASPSAEADETKSPAKASAKGGAVSWSPLEQERELGQIRWRRDYDVARAEAKRRSRPLFVLFDEVPG